MVGRAYFSAEEGKPHHYRIYLYECYSCGERNPASHIPLGHCKACGYNAWETKFNGELIIAKDGYLLIPNHPRRSPMEL